MKPIVKTSLVVMLCALSASGCRRGSATSPELLGSPEGRACSGDGVIDDGEDGNNQILTHGGRGGYWYTFVDETGSSVTPTAGSQGGTFEMTAGGANGTKQAAHMTGSISTSNIVYGGMGFNFVDPKGQYDASKYTGITFWAKKGPGSTKNVRLKMPDINTDPDGGICSECFNDFGADLQFSDEWQKYVILFDDMKQLKGWGSPRKSSIEKGTLYAIQFQVNDKGSNYDIWVDEIAFAGCQ
jgi:endoglucanase